MQDWPPRAVWLVRRADDALVLGHRLSEWCGHAPMLEEDLALANIALDQIGLARALYQEAGAMLGKTEDELAYLRDARSYLNVLLAEQPNGDFACTIARQLLFSAAMLPFWRQAALARDEAVAAIAAKAVKEAAYHLRHASEWTVRLGDGTPESHARMEAALEQLWPFADELFEQDAIEREMAAADLQAVHEEWESTIADVLARAALARPAAAFPQSGGRAGRHSEAMGRMLAELQYLQRAYPGASW